MPAIRTHVDVHAHPTVVRLSDADAPWVVDSYHLTDPVRGHVDALVHALSRPTGTGVFLIGPYGSGKSHLLAWLSRRLETLVATPPRIVAISLLHYSADARLEDIVCRALGIEVGTEDRRAAWSAYMEREPAGAVVLIDELSEFLRSKPDRASFNEDVRTLQFLGEWAMGARFTIVAAMQEQIEHTGDLDTGLYRKIKDRFPVRLTLTPLHTRQLIADHLLVKGPDYEASVSQLAKRFTEALPQAAEFNGALTAIYPIHPMTLTLLEEVRDAFSQTRGVVDFVVTRLRGDPARGIDAFLDEEWGRLITPDNIVVHFSDVLQQQPTFLPLTQRLFPWMQSALPELFDSDRLRDLGRALLHLLALTWIAPAREILTVDEAATWLLFAATRLDPERNRKIVRRVLDKLATEGRYVRCVDGAYQLALDDDSAEQLERLVQRELADLPTSAEALLEPLAKRLGKDRFNPLSLDWNRHSPRVVQWEQHPRNIQVWAGNGTPNAHTEPVLCVRTPWGRARAAFGVPTVLPRQIEPSSKHRRLAALLLVLDRPIAPDVRERVTRAVGDGLIAFSAEVRAAFAEAKVVDADGKRLAPVHVDARTTTASWIGEHARSALRARYPSFERFAPAHGPLPRVAWQEFWRAVLAEGVLTNTPNDWLEVIRTGYLVPLGLLRRTGRTYVVPERLDRNELVRTVTQMVRHAPEPALLYSRFAEPTYGFVPDQVTALLAFLHSQGEIDIVNKGVSWREAFETMHSPLQYEKITAGRALSAADAGAFQRLCAALDVRTTDPWTPFSQRRAAKKLAARLAPVEEASVALIPQLEAAEAATSVDNIRKFSGDCDALRHEDELTGVELLLGRIGSMGQFARTFADLQALPGRLGRHHRELRRYANFIDTLAENPLAPELAAYPSAPNLGQGTEVEAWLEGAKTAHDAYKARYRSAHDEWWQTLDTGPLSWSPPAVASSRHLGLARALRERSDEVKLATQGSCRRLSDLDYQPICQCGFDGQTARAHTHIAAASVSQKQIETQLRQFFGQPEIRARVQEWADLNTESDALQPYLSKVSPWPSISDLEAFDRHLAGVAVVHDVDGPALLEWLADRTWTRPELAAAWSGRAAAWGERIRFQKGDVVAGEVRTWCTRQALKHGVALPAGLGASDIDPSMVDLPGLKHLEDLGLGEAAVDSVLQMLFDGRIAIPDGDIAPLAAAVRDACMPEGASSAEPEALADRVARLYAAHRRLAPLGGDRWKKHLDRLAASPVQVPLLEDALGDRLDTPWCLLDGVGLAIWPTVRDHLTDLLPQWRIARVTYATVGQQTTTKACYERLIEAGLDHPFEKVDVVDNLLHDRFLPFKDLCAIAIAELRAELRQRSLDPTRPLVVFADHGFRLSADAQRWEHGGSSALERVVPVIELRPR